MGYNNLCHYLSILHMIITSSQIHGRAGQPLFPNNSGQLHRKEFHYTTLGAVSTACSLPPLTQQLHAAVQKMLLYTPQPRNDKLLWNFSASGNFTVSSVYKILSQGGKLRTPTPLIWRTKATPSMKCLIYFLLHNKLLTHDILLRRNINHMPGCVMCDARPAETAVHLFFRCPYATQIWTALPISLGYTTLQVSETPMQTYLASTPKNKQRGQFWQTTFVTATSLLWRERNDRIFNQKRASVSVLLAKIRHEAYMCYNHC